MRLEPAAPQSPVKHSTTEPLRSLNFSIKLDEGPLYILGGGGGAKFIILDYCDR